ncbi:MAG: alpha-xylosidase [Hyphomicrobiales bacterium]
MALSPRHDGGDADPGRVRVRLPAALCDGRHREHGDQMTGADEARRAADALPLFGMPSTAAAEPDWSRIAPARLVGSPEPMEGGAVSLETSIGPLIVTFGSDYVRLCFGRSTKPVYPILAGEPAIIPARIISCGARALASEGPIPPLPGLDPGIRGGGIKRPIAGSHLAKSEGDVRAVVQEDEETSGPTILEAGVWRLVLTDAPLAFELQREGKLVLQSATDGHFTRERRLPPFARTADGFLASFDLVSGERVYGLGEKWGRLDHRGSLIRSLTFDALGVNAERSYKNAPFAWSTAGWGVFVHTPAPVTHGIGYPIWSHRAYVIAVEDETLDLFLLAGRDGPGIIRAYTGLTGRAPRIPAWSFGTILSKAYYRTAGELLSVAREVRARGMPCETITLDGRAWQDTSTRFVFNFDRTRYPDPRSVLAELRSLNFRICIWEYPLVSVDGPLFAEMAAKGFLIKDRRSGEPYRYEWDKEPFGQVLTPLPASGLVDFTNPAAYAFWRDSHRLLFDLGVDMIKPDFGEQIEPDCLAHNGDTGHRLHNVYPLIYNACVHEACERYGRAGAFLFSRSAYAGSQRYPGQWGGDPQADFEGLAASIRGGLSWSMSGAPFYAHDVGGFYGDRRDPELYVRWAQAAIFFSHLRFHGVGAREPWSYGGEAETAVMKALKIRERLIPDLQRLAAEASASGMPVQRAMALACPDEPEAFAFEEQFFCGPDILVAPCLRPGGKVTLYLPKGRWRRFPDGTRILQGGRMVELDLALDEIAAFRRERSSTFSRLREKVPRP